MVDIFSAEQMASQIFDGAVLIVSGNSGGIVEPDYLMEAIEKRFLETGHPNNITFIHSFGIGDRAIRGSNRFAHKGMVKRVISGHYTWSYSMQQLVKDNQIEAYCFPSGVIQQLLREIAAGRPGLFTSVGLGTFVDPRIEGGKANTFTKENLVDLVVIDGKEYLRYKPFNVDFAIIRGTFSDRKGNISLEEEPLNLDVLNIAMAAHNCGGKVFVQVRDIVENGTLNPKQVNVPGVLVNGIIEYKSQQQTYLCNGYDNSLSGKFRRANCDTDIDKKLPYNKVRLLIARRAALELKPGLVANFGYGIPGAIPSVAKQMGIVTDSLWKCMEQGVHNGYLQDDPIFGSSVNADAIISSVDQFDFFCGGGLDITFLGLGEVDENGNENVSLLNRRIIGPGGFMDIASKTKKIVFCGTFDTVGSKININSDGVHVIQKGSIRKFVKRVNQVTFSSKFAKKSLQKVMYITERAVFVLTDEGLELIEIAPGVDLQQDILGCMDFVPIINDIKFMDSSLFYKF